MAILSHTHLVIALSPSLDKDIQKVIRLKHTPAQSTTRRPFAAMTSTAGYPKVNLARIIPVRPMTVTPIITSSVKLVMLGTLQIQHLSPSPYQTARARLAHPNMTTGRKEGPPPRPELPILLPHRTPARREEYDGIPDPLQRQDDCRGDVETIAHMARVDQVVNAVDGTWGPRDEDRDGEDEARAEVRQLDRVQAAQARVEVAGS